jgi:hypothetical protein
MWINWPFLGVNQPIASARINLCLLMRYYDGEREHIGLLVGFPLGLDPEGGREGRTGTGGVVDFSIRLFNFNAIPSPFVGLVEWPFLC